MKKRLYKDHSEEKLFGVCSGVAKYFDWDPTIVRLAWVLFCAVFGTGVAAYIICAFVIPDEPGYKEED